MNTILGVIFAWGIAAVYLAIALSRMGSVLDRFGQRSRGDALPQGRGCVERAY